MSYLLYNCRIVTGEKVADGIIRIDGEKITDVIYADGSMVAGNDGRMASAELKKRAIEILAEGGDIQGIDLGGKWVFAGGVDVHVHFREPGLTRKADISSESAAALLGGVTSFIDMPNTNPPTTSLERIREKISAAEGRSYANFGFHFGATDSNSAEIASAVREHPGEFAGIKVFMGSSTGNMLVEDENALANLFNIKGKPVLVHCEDEALIRANLRAAEEKYGENIPFEEHPNIRSRRACILSSAKALEMAMKCGTRLHLCHISTKEEVEMLRAAKLHNKGISGETSVNYLWFSDQDYAELGSHLKCNPAIKSAEDREALRAAVLDGIIDSIGSDHAPHLLVEKDGSYLRAPSGLPSIQQTLQVLLTLFADYEQGLSRIAAAFSQRPADITGIIGRGYIKPGYYADLAIVDGEAECVVNQEDIAYKCGWSPYQGERLRGCIDTVFLNGKMMVRDGRLIEGLSPGGKALRFQ